MSNHQQLHLFVLVTLLTHCCTARPQFFSFIPQVPHNIAAVSPQFYQAVTPTPPPKQGPVRLLFLSFTRFPWPVENWVQRLQNYFSTYTVTQEPLLIEEVDLGPDLVTEKFPGFEKLRVHQPMNSYCVRPTLEQVIRRAEDKSRAESNFIFLYIYVVHLAPPLSRSRVVVVAVFTMRIHKVVLVLVALVSVVRAAPTANRPDDYDNNPRQFLVNRLTGNDFPGVVYFDQPAVVPLQGFSYYVAVPNSESGATRQSIINTLTGYVTQAASSVTNLVPRPPYTVNVQNVLSGLANRVTNGITAVQNAWQSRPAFLRPTEATPTKDPHAEIIPSDELIAAANPQPIAVFAPEAPIATADRLNRYNL
ncbi:hypothetical protein B566_EDAN006038 [Ephemera danica]|nr:hypothetical protein B566_EDAN006038 [Ephemera danica]